MQAELIGNVVREKQVFGVYKNPWFVQYNVKLKNIKARLFIVFDLG